MRIAELETEGRASRKMIEGRDTEIARLNAALKEAQADRTAFETRLQKAEADLVRLQLDQTDRVALRAQLDRLKKQWPPLGYAPAPETRARTEAKGGAEGLTARVDSTASGYYLQMQADGTVKLIPSYEGVGSAAR